MKRMLWIGLAVMMLLAGCAGQVSTQMPQETPAGQVSLPAQAEPTAQVNTADAPQDAEQTAPGPVVSVEMLCDISNYPIDFEYEGEDYYFDPTEDDLEYARLTGRDEEGRTVWQTWTVGVSAQRNTPGVIHEIGVQGDRYYYVIAGSICCVDLATGDVLWENDEYQSSEYAVMHEGENGMLYFASMDAAPIFFAVDQEGVTWMRSERNPEKVTGYVTDIDQTYDGRIAVHMVDGNMPVVYFNPETGDMTGV